jgi:hypothetical protein
MGNGFTASIKRAAERSTMELPFHIPPKEWFTIKEVAQLTGMSETFIEEVFDKSDFDGKGPLGGHKHNAGTGQRKSKRIPRINVVAYLVTTANYEIDGIVDEQIRTLQHLSEMPLRRIAASALARADKLAAQRKSA